MIQHVVSEALKDKQFSISLDLGCGTGDGGEILRSHTRRLIGVDMDPDALSVAGSRGLYDELHLADIREWPLGNADSVALFDSLEHIRKEEGHHLLQRCSDRYTILTTPWYSVPLLSNLEHKCLWSDEELRRLGFKTTAYSFMPDVGMWILYGGIILAVRNWVGLINLQV